jgi:hypothetical protein
MNKTVITEKRGDRGSSYTQKQTTSVNVWITIVNEGISYIYKKRYIQKIKCFVVLTVE